MKNGRRVEDRFVEFIDARRDQLAQSKAKPWPDEVPLLTARDVLHWKHEGVRLWSFKPRPANKGTLAQWSARTFWGKCRFLGVIFNEVLLERAAGIPSDLSPYTRKVQWGTVNGIGCDMRFSRSSKASLWNAVMAHLGYDVPAGMIGQIVCHYERDRWQKYD